MHIQSVYGVAVGVLTIDATQTGGNGQNNGTADSFRLVLNGANVEVHINGTHSQSTAFSGITSIAVNGSNDNDSLELDFSGGDVLPSGGINFAAAGGSGDSMTITGAGNAAAATIGYTPNSTTTGTGRLQIGPIGGNTVDFSGLDPITVTGVTNFTLTTPNGDDTITIDSPAAGQNQISGTSAGVGFEALTFSTITNFTLDAFTNDDASPSDSVTLDATGLVATGLASFSLTTGNGGAGTTLNGPVSLSDGFTVQSGTINVNSTVVGTGSGFVVMTSEGGSSLSINSAITTASGAITLQADDDVLLAAAGDLTSTSGDVQIVADLNGDTNGSGGAVTLGDLAVINADSGTITIVADENIALGRLITTNATASAVSVTSVSGAITDAGDTGGTDVSAVNGTATLTANNVTNGAIGTQANAIESSVATLIASAGGANGLNVANTGNVVATLTADNGTAKLSAASTLGTSGVWSANAFDIDATGNITLSNNITVDTATGIDINSSGGNISISAGVILDSSAANGPISLTSDDLTISTSAILLLGTGTTLLIPNAGRSMDIGAVAGDQYVVTDAELDRINDTGNTIAIGSVLAGEIVIAGSVTHGGTNLTVTTGGNNSITFSGATAILNTGSTSGNVTLTTNASGTGGIFSGGFVGDVGANGLVLTAGSGGIGTSGNPFAISAEVMTADTSATNTNQFLNEIDGSSAFFAGVGLTTANALNAGTGTIQFNGGRFEAENTNSVNDSTSLNVLSGATFQLNGIASETIAGLSGDGTVEEAGSGSVVLTVGFGNATSTFSGVLQNGSNTLGLTKTGTGTQTLSGTNTYTSATTVNAQDNDLMSATLGTDDRRLPTSDVDDFFSRLIASDDDALLPFGQ